MAFLPPYLLDAWRLHLGDERQAKKDDQLKGWTASSLAEFYIKYQLDKHYSALRDRGTPMASLSSIAVGKLLDLLQKSEDLITDAATIADSLSSTTLRQLLEDPRTPYQVLRIFDSVPQTMVGKNRRILDVDEAVLRSEHYIRSRGLQNRDGKYLVGLEDLCSIVTGMPTNSKAEGDIHSINNKPLRFTRRDPPKGGLEVLDYWRPRQLSINSSDESFKSVFDRITQNILRGLDWNNVMIAGGMALTTLLHTDPARDDIHSVKDPDIDVYIYGLGPEDANRKAEEIHDTWVRNLPSSVSGRLVVKNAKTINLLTDYPNRRIQIVLKLLPSPTDVLLNFDLDACAIGFDGSHVFMLPRCARAIETGYSVFTMDLVWGHHLGNRRASQDSRIFKYANRGFGLRFLPSYAQSIEEDNSEMAIPTGSYTPDCAEKVDQTVLEHDDFGWSQRVRKPNGAEPGLKTLKRIAYLSQDYLHRFYFGATPLAISPQQLRRQGQSEALTTSHSADIGEDDWQDMCQLSLVEQGKRDLLSSKRRTNNEHWNAPRIMLSDLDTQSLHHGLPDGRRGLGNLEIFLRHCEAFRLSSRADVWLDSDSTATLAYDSETYDDMPIYKWNKHFDIDDFASTIDQYNNRLWADVKTNICSRLGIPIRMSGFARYSTRRIRRLVHGPDFRTVQEKQITIPLMVPWGLENHVLATIPQEYSDIPSHFVDFPALIPVHDPSKHDPTTSTLPSLHDTASEAGNLRYWIITNESMWASQDRVLDEIAETLWSLFYSFTQSITLMPNDATATNTDRPECCWRLARSFRRRIVLPEVLDNPLRENLLFRAWALISPVKPDREFTGDDGRHEMFDEEAVLYPFPDELFWDPSDEGAWIGEGAPEWIEVPADQGTVGQREWGIDPLSALNTGEDFGQGNI